MHEPRQLILLILKKQIMFQSVFYTFGFIALLCLFSCHPSPSKETNLTVNKTNQEELPFFNQPDWTPEWISKADSAYKNIHSIPDFAFTNQEGKKISQDNVSGKIYVTNFFFSRCRGICPKMTGNMQKLQEAYIKDPEVMLLSYSVTPESDSVPVLKKYAADNNINADKWSLLTGDRESIYTLAKREYFAGDSIGYYQAGNEFLHTENFILIDKHKRIRGVYNGTLPVEIERIKNDISTLKLEE